MRIFLGYDPREAIGTWVFQHSVLRRTSGNADFHPIWRANDPMGGTNTFTYARFGIPYHAGYAGPPVLFCDGADMICLTDICELEDMWQYGKAVQLVKRPDYVATSPKYVGTEMESDNKSYPRKNWSSVMFIYPGHFGWRKVNWGITDPAYWAEFGWLKDNEIGELPDVWNRLVDEGDPVEGGKILHWTLGIPGIPAYANSPGAHLWQAEYEAALRTPKQRSER